MAALSFDQAVEALRSLHHGAETLPRLAHAAGQPTARLAADLHAFLRSMDRTVHIAHRTENPVLTCGAREGPGDVVDLPPGYTLVPRSERVPAPVRGERSPSEPVVLQMTARGDLEEVEGLPEGYRMVPRGMPL